MKRFSLTILGLMLSMSTVLSVQVRNTPGVVAATVPADRTPAEHHAAEELSEALTKMGIKRLTLRSGLIRIHLGATREAVHDCPDIDSNKLGPDEFVIRTVKDRLDVLGGRPRGLLNGVHRLLHILGVRWWTPWAADYPKNTYLTLAPFNIHEKPVFEYRDPYWHGAFQTEWASRNLCNGWNEGLKDVHGNGTVYEGFVHTYYALVDPKTQFAVHPEWFSLIGGKRTAENAQLCTTNPELRKYVLEQVRKRLRANPKATIVSVSQNDCFNPCQCDICQALAKTEGSQSAPVIALANYVADGIRHQFPNVAVDTLAYQWSRHAPKTLKPKPNVIVRLCSIECDFGTPLDQGRNIPFATDIKDWSRLTRRLYIWDYVTNFRHYLQPLPDYATIGPNMRFFAANGGKGLFEEGDYNSEGGDMGELKNWLQAQLLWNPNQDDRKLTDEFLRGYYGPVAAGFIRKYLDLMIAAAALTPISIFDGTDKPYLSYKTMREAERNWKLAEDQSAMDSVRLARVRRSHLGVQYVWLSRWNAFRSEAQTAGDSWPFPDSKEEAARQWLALAESKLPDGTPPVKAVDEGGETPAAFIAKIKG